MVFTSFSIAAKFNHLVFNELCGWILQLALFAVFAALHRPTLGWQLPLSLIAEYVVRFATM